ncbi:MAG: histone family protein [Candidatus Helarchaeota archaeon]
MGLKRRDKILPLAPIDRLIREAKADRVSEKAVKKLGAILEEIALEIATMAKELAEHAHRKTVIDADIKLAYKQWRRI